jgi:hypothetical protein
MKEGMVSIESVIRIVRSGGRIRTGVDIFAGDGVLLLDKDELVESAQTLEVIKENGILFLPVNVSGKGGIWTESGELIAIPSESNVSAGGPPALKPQAVISGELKKRLEAIAEGKQQAVQQFGELRDCIRQMKEDIRKSGGEFDFQETRKQVSQFCTYLASEGHEHLYFNRQIFTFDDYLFNHAINVCITVTRVLDQFNEHFSAMVNSFLRDRLTNRDKDFLCDPKSENENKCADFKYFYRDERDEVTLGGVLFDVGKFLIPEALLNKQGKLTRNELSLFQRHSFEYGVNILEKNRIYSAIVRNMVAYHHGPLYHGEKGGYPDDRTSSQIPIYVKICRLADMYDAMISRRSYREAVNQVSAITDLFRSYVKKDTILQFVLRAFIRVIGIYPAGSIVYLKNGQLAYILDSKGPVVIPFTDTAGKTLTRYPDPVNLGEEKDRSQYAVDESRRVFSSKDVYPLLPEYLRQVVMPM